MGEQKHGKLLDRSELRHVRQVYRNLDNVRELRVGCEQNALEVLDDALGLRTHVLADYLAGDRYFRVSEPDDNLQRCREPRAAQELFD